MKFLSTIAIILAFASPSLATSGKYCPQEFDQAVEKLEEVYKSSFDIVGDLAYPKYQGRYIGAFGQPTLEKRVFVPHQSINGTVWFNEYEVTLKAETCELEKFAFKGSSTPKTCINNVTAKAKLEKYLNDQKDTVPLDDFPWLDEEDEDSVLTSSKIAQTLNSMYLSNHSGIYDTESSFSQQCAAGADCWGWYTVACDGTVEAMWDGD